MKKVNIIKYAVSSIIMLLMIVLANKVQAATATVTADTLNLRSQASTDSSIVKLLNKGEKLEIISDDGDWIKVSYNGAEGYVSKDYIEINDDTPIESNNQEQPNTSETTESGNITETNTTTTSAKLNTDTQIRILPLINASIIENIASGSEVKVITSTNKWSFVETDTISGWIVNTTLGEKISSDNNGTPETTEEPEENTNNEENQNTTDTEENENSDKMYETSVTKYINGSSVYIRNKPSTDADIVISLIKNTDVTVVGENGDWYKVEYNNYEGYIYKELLADEKVAQTNRHDTVQISESVVQDNIEQTSNTTNLTLGQEIVEYAQQYLGCPYVYGGSGSSSFDCSGFTMYVYKNFGYTLSHSARAQSKMGTYVDKDNLQPGDLVFFLDYETMDDIGHCGIYIGNGNFIHASSGTGYCVKISTLLSGSYDKRYATARRLI